MKTSIVIAITTAALMCLTGCKRDCWDCDGWSWEEGPQNICCVHITMDTDTLRFLPGDSASARGYVEVKNTQGQFAPGVKIYLELTEPVGWIEYADNNLRDTTNSLGRMEFRFRTYNQSGDNVIQAWVDSHEDTWPIHVEPSTALFGSLTATLDPDTLYWPQDSVTLSMTLTDSSHAGIPGVSLSVAVSCGQLGYLSATDNSGYTHCVAHIGECVSPWCVYWTIGGRRDSACVVILDTTRHS